MTPEIVKMIVSLVMPSVEEDFINTNSYIPQTESEKLIEQEITKSFINTLEALEIEIKDRSYLSILKQLLNYYLITRSYYTENYSWAIPSVQVVNAISKYQNIVEIYAGTGYWANLIEKAGCRIQCYDNFMSHYKKESYGKFYPVTNINELNYDLLQNCNLFMSWIPYEDECCIKYISNLNPKNILYLGETEGGCNACDKFFDIVNKNYAKVNVITFPTWLGLHDCFCEFRRKL